MTDILGRDADDSPIGDRVASSGWPLADNIRLIKAEASGTTVFQGGLVFRGRPGVKVTLEVNGQEVAGKPVVLDDDYLVCEPLIVGRVKPHRAVLDDFVALAADPSDAAVLAYARRNGLLGLAPAERPEGRRSVESTPWVGELVAPTVGYRHAPAVLREPLRLWHRIIGEVAAVYNVAGHLRQDKTVAMAAWDPLAGIILLPYPEADGGASEPAQVPVDAGPLMWVYPATLDGQRQALTAILGTWLALGAVRPVITWGDPRHDDPVVTLGTATLFGGLVLELLLAVAGQPGFAMCSGCGRPFTPRRRPPAGPYGATRKTFCPTCRVPNEDRKTPLPQLETARRWRAKNPDYYRDRQRLARRKDQTEP